MAGTIAPRAGISGGITGAAVARGPGTAVAIALAMTFGTTQLARILGGLLVLLPALAWGCSSNVDDGDGETGGCAEPEPPSDGPCPPAWACVNGEWVNGAGACPNECPDQEPVAGEACPETGLECEYWREDEPCGEAEHWETVLCTPTGWAILEPRCSPPLECPDSLPIDGSDCTGWEDAWDCYFTSESGCGPIDTYANCTSENGAMTWSVTLGGTCESCDALLDPATCSANEACRWLEPGCGEPPLPAAGCFPAEDCAPDACGTDATCTKVIIDPCWNSPCDACGGEALVCLPSPEL